LPSPAAGDWMSSIALVFGAAPSALIDVPTCCACTGSPSAAAASAAAAAVFHTVENPRKYFPCCGKFMKTFSIPWKTFFHRVENSALPC
jgi:hypothetical protein